MSESNVKKKRLKLRFDVGATLVVSAVGSAVDCAIRSDHTCKQQGLLSLVATKQDEDIRTLIN
jgi:hypothetical protein